MIRIEYKGAIVHCSDQREAQDMLRFIASENDRARGTYASGTKNPWDGKLFWKFVESIGHTQRNALKLLLEKGELSDEELRLALKLTSNQQLAGALSGLSKQAAALGIPARAVFKIENESKSGQITKSYTIAQEFVLVAQENNWPEGD